MDNSHFAAYRLDRTRIKLPYDLLSAEWNGDILYILTRRSSTV